VIMVNCDGALSRYCISMSAAGLSPRASTIEKKAICAICRKRRDLILNEFGFPSILLDNFVGMEEEHAIREIILTAHSRNYTELNWMNIPIGKYALYEFLLNNKLNSLNLNNAEWEEYKIYLFNTLKAAYAGRKILDEIKPEVIVTYNSLYSVNHVLCALAEQRGVPHYTLHAGDHIDRRYSTMTIFKGLVSSRLVARTETWRQLSNMPISPRQVQVVAEHINALLKATDPWVYSLASKKANSESLRNYFRISKDKRVLLATMASADERFSAATIDAMPPFIEPMFPAQIDWINALIKFVSHRNDLFLIIRVHPREFPNKREQVLSKQAAELQKLLVNLPSNIGVNWPKDQISLHDLIKITDVGLNATSTSGIELGMFGAPVVLYDSNQLFSYPSEINYVAKDPEDYFKKIDMAIKDGWSIENVRMVFRWLSYKFEYVSIDISDGLGKIKELPRFVKLYYRLLQKFNKNYSFEESLLVRKLKQRPIPVKNSEKLSVAIERNLESHLKLENIVNDAQFSYEEETIAIRAQVQKMLQMMAWDDDASDILACKIRRVLSG